MEKVLGQGGTGAVSLASDLRIPEKRWAVKELFDFGDPDTRSLVQEQFKKEAAILAGLDHPNLPRITDFFVEDDREYLVMDFIQGKSLEEILIEKKSPLDLGFVYNIASQSMDVLGYLHNLPSQIVFRDLKPSNVMVCPDGNIKLIDFGIARIFTAGKSKDTVVMGTPRFCST